MHCMRELAAGGALRVVCACAGESLGTFFRQTLTISLSVAAVSDGRATLRVMTYNVLAQVYVKSCFFPYCTPSVLRWKRRSNELVRPIAYVTAAVCLCAWLILWTLGRRVQENVFAALPVQPDVICLQVD